MSTQKPLPSTSTTSKTSAPSIDQCSVGIFKDDSCHKTTYKVSSKLNYENDFSQDDWQLILARVDKNITSICNHHKKVYIEYYTSIYGNRCINPLDLHTVTSKQAKSSKNKSLRIISLEFYQQALNKVKLIPGKKICTTCYQKVSNLIKEEVNIGATQSEEDPAFPTPHKVNLLRIENVAKELGVSPIQPLVKLSKHQRPQQIKRKASQIRDAVLKKMSSGLQVKVTEGDSDGEEITQESKKLGEDYERLINDIKDKLFNTESSSEKIRLLTLAPKSWSIQKVANEFSVTIYQADKSIKLRNERGILPDIGPKLGRKLDQKVIDTIVQFYQVDEYSRVFPGLHDKLSVRIDGEKEQKQKRLILCNLKELCQAYCQQYPGLEYKVGFSKFAELRPKWCVLAGAPGTHSVCVCTYHQNMKLMIAGAKISKTYQELLAMMVCSLTSEECMLGKCQACSGVNVVRHFLDTDEDYNLLTKNG